MALFRLLILFRLQAGFIPEIARFDFNLFFIVAANMKH